MSDDRTQIVQTLTWFWFIAASLAVATRGLTKAIIVRSLNIDDFLISLSFVRIPKTCTRCHDHRFS